MLDNNFTTITKICNYYWFKILERRYSRETRNIASIFKASGLWSLYFTAIQSQLKLFKDDGILLLEVNPNCMRCRETVQMEVMLLPPEIDRPPQSRWKVDVNNWLLSI